MTDVKDQGIEEGPWDQRRAATVEILGRPSSLKERRKHVGGLRKGEGTE
jgi:hypothetical protein